MSEPTRLRFDRIQEFVTIEEYDQLRLALQESQQARANLQNVCNAYEKDIQESQQRVAGLEHANNSWIHENEKWKDQRDQQQATLQELAEALREIIRWSPKAFPDGIAYRNAKKLADAALAKAAPWLKEEK